MAAGRTCAPAATATCPTGKAVPKMPVSWDFPPDTSIQQMADYKNGLRKTSEAKMGPPNTMMVIGKAANDAEVKAAAEYFASIKPKPWIKVIETKMVPKTHVSGWMFVETEGAGKGMEPIGSRVIEMPVDLERTELRDSKSSFIAYAPVGSIKKGEALVTTGGAGKTIKCSICHGADLKGLGNVPSISGRSPSYIARQLYDIQQGQSQWSLDPADEGSRGETDGRRHGIDHGLSGVPQSVTLGRLSRAHSRRYCSRDFGFDCLCAVEAPFEAMDSAAHRRRAAGPAGSLDQRHHHALRASRAASG